MALDDRDRSFEKALARHLRYAAPTGEEAASLSSGSLPCPDPEILAAYHDGSLSPDERTFWKQHVLSCDRCQLVLEHLATPLAVPVGVQSNEAPAEDKLIARESVVAAPAAAPASISRRAPRRTYFWWLAPTGAVAAGLLAFLVLHPAKPVPAPQPAPVESAENRQPQTPQRESAPTRTAPLVANHAPKAKDRDAFVAGGAAPSPRAADDKGLREETQLAQKALQLSKSAPSSPLLYDAGKLERDNKAASSGARTANEKQDELKNQVAALDAEMKKQGLAQQSPAPLPAVGGQAGYLSDNLAAPPPPAKAAAGAPSAPAAPKPAQPQNARADNLNSPLSAATESVEVSSQPQAAARMRATLLQNPHVFGVAGGKVLWRIGPAGSIERSTNEGKDWTPQDSGVTADLLAGSASSAKVSWIVGTSGTILRTTDGGAHWTKLSSPAVTGELAGVRATDARRAFIWFTADPRTGLVPRFQTSDGGATWVPVPND